MASGMFGAAKRLVAADLRRQHPDVTPAELRVRMFDRLYFGDFPHALLAQDRLGIGRVPACRSR